MMLSASTSHVSLMGFGLYTQHPTVTGLPWRCKTAAPCLVKCTRPFASRSTVSVTAYRDPSQQPGPTPHLPTVSAATALNTSATTVPAPTTTGASAAASISTRGKQSTIKAPKADDDAAHGTSAEKMSWTKQWWPMAVEESLDPNLPHKVTLMGRELVLWKTSEGVWSCLDNACPHRGAPLDQGRLQGNCLQCSYHGWQFAADGACKDIPQSEFPAKYCSMRAATVAAYPVRAAQGLLWVWGEPGQAAAQEAAATPLKADPDVDDPDL